MNSLRTSGWAFTLSAAAFVLVGGNLLLITQPTIAQLRSPAIGEALLVMFLPAILAAVCAFVLLRRGNAPRWVLFLLLGLSFVACIGIVLSGWPLLSLLLAPAAVLLLIALRRPGA